MSDEEGGGGGHGAVWLVSYADMVTLIMALFIVLYTMSQVDAAKMKKLVESMHQAFAPIAGGAEGVVGRKVKTPTAGLMPDGGPGQNPAMLIHAGGTPGNKKGESRADRELTAVVDDVAKLAKKLHVEKQLKTKLTGRGAVITLDETVSSSGGLVPFESGSAGLSGWFRRLLDSLAPKLRLTGNKIEVQGHTDSRPIRSAAYPSNWELSCARAGSVARYLEERHGFSRRQLVCSGFADSLPLTQGRNAAELARNRRIEIVITRQPIDAYDRLSRADAVSQPKDITSPIGNALVPTGLPHQKDHPPADGKPRPAPAKEPAASGGHGQADQHSEPPPRPEPAGNWGGDEHGAPAAAPGAAAEHGGH
ncbi:MAG: flagellar motor protein MotB [Fimbriimonadaceae bacterium]|nr:flagellar motor protein MotB [Fimbriimonadaceae bacterium]